MNKRTTKITYWTSTALLSLLIIYSVGFYFLSYEETVTNFKSLSFPTYLIYPLAFAKIIGLFLIWVRPSRTFTEWAYCGFFFNFILAFTAHINAGDGQFTGALIAFILLVVSYFSQRNLSKS